MDSENIEKISFLEKENEILKRENKNLKEQLDVYKSKNIYAQYKEIYGNGLNFCYNEYEEYYFKEDFEEKLRKICSILPKESKDIFKYYFLRALFVNLIRKPTLFTPKEIEEQNIVKNNYHLIDEEFKFLKDHAFHSVDLNLSDEDKEFVKNKDIIDAGAYFGDTSLPLSKLTNKKVYAFEPFDDSYDLLEKHIEINNIENVVPIKKSVGNINGEKTLFLTGVDFTGITSKPEYRADSDWEKLIVQECSIDKFVEENDVDLGYVNVDVEGGELELLKGAINTINEQKPILAISIYHQAIDFFEIILWIDNLNLGYEFEIIKENPYYFLQETMVIARVKE